VPPLALVGNLSRDVVDGGPPRIGGGPYYAARAWRALGTRGTIFTRCGPEDRHAYVRLLTALGLPVVSLEGAATTSFSFHYEGDTRIMTVVQPGDTWTAADADVVPPDGWIHVAPLLRSDFPAETLAALARGRHLSLDGQGLVRAAETGPLRLDAGFDPAVLEHVQILKLAEEEAEVVGAIDKLDVAEVLVTFGERGSRVYHNGRVEDVGAWPVAMDPTGSGDAFSAAYLAGRAQGLAPVSAARQATGVVGALLTGRAT
jgi:sugar/nucleoside kinase (ribokinase family)